MKHIIQIIALLLLTTVGFAENKTLTLYADGCDSANVISCPIGQQVRITAEETLAGSQFVRWSDGDTSQVRLLTVNDDMSLTAYYKTSTTYTLTLYANGCPTSNVIICPEGQQIRVTAESTLEGNHFTGWSDGVVANPRIVTINSDIILTALYETVTSLVNVSNPLKQSEVQKIIRDGQVLILRGGKTYNALGMEIE